MTTKGGDPVEGLWYSPSPVAAAARAALAPLSVLFGVGVRVRAGLHDRGLVRVERAPAPVVSVGALRVGGAGKTPFVLWLVEQLRRRGRRPVVVTRGYGGTSGGSSPWILGPGDARATGAADRGGDEAVLLALRSGAPVAIGADRSKSCAMAASALAGSADEPDLFVLDDGFQHRRLARDLDVVLVSGTEAEEALLPAGPLREPVSALSRAGAVVLVRGRSGGARSASSEPSSAKQVAAVLRVVGVVDTVEQHDPADVESLRGKRAVAVAGIARPERFLADLDAAGVNVAASVLRRDHHRFTDEDRREIDRASADADFVVTTEKDLVKLAGSSFRAPLVALRVAVEMENASAGDALVDRAASLRPI